MSKLCSISVSDNNCTIINGSRIAFEVGAETAATR